MSGLNRFLLALLAVGTCGLPAVAELTDVGLHQPQRQLVQELIEIIDQNNPTLSSQAQLVARSATVSAPRSSSAITGLSVSAGIVDYYYTQQAFGYAPTASISLNIAIADPGRALNILRITQEKESAKQQWDKARSEAIKQLFANINQILQLQSRQSSLADLKVFLDGYTAYVEKQVKQGGAEPDRLLPLKERRATLAVELQDTKNQLGTLRLETAMTLGGTAWEQMLQLLLQLKEFP